MNKDRFLAFHDAILAIIMTILVLELQVPKSITFAGFWHQRVEYLAYLISFLWLGTMWIELSNQWKYVKKVSNRMIWISLFMLLFASLFPYTTKIVASNFYNLTAQLIYGLIAFGTTSINYFLSHYILRVSSNNPRVKQVTIVRLKWLRLDLVIKLIGLISSLIYPPLVMITVMISMIVIVVSADLIEGQSKNNIDASHEKGHLAK